MTTHIHTRVDMPVSVICTIGTVDVYRCRSSAASVADSEATSLPAESASALLSSASQPITAQQQPPAATSQGQTSTAAAVQLTRHVVGSFIWTNQQPASLAVPAHQTTTFALQATFNQPGVYNISSSLRVRARPLTHRDAFAHVTEAILQTAPSPCLIKIG